ncbi:hypothetical protein ACFFRR_001931 [Megaselia abdita]
MVEKNLQPWERIGWNEETQQAIYRDWGCYYFQRSINIELAIHYFKKSLELRHDDPKATYLLSLSKKYVALCESAYKDAIRALRLVDLNFPINKNVCDVLYDWNRIEDAGVELISKSRKFVGQKVKPFQHKFDVVTENLTDSMGDAMWYFITDYKKYFNAVTDIRKGIENPDDRPMWKILREKDECDILSILDVIEPLVHPREQARLDRGYKIFCSTYLNRSAIDVMFLKSLTKNKTLLLPQFKSTPVLKKFVDTKYQTVIKFLKMLQARSPLYHEREKRCLNKSMCEANKKAAIFRTKNSTRRVCIIVLNRVKELRERGNIHELTNMVEEIMGDYISVKTHTMMPWKFEFINEVHNTLALAHMDQLVIPDYINAFRSEEEQLFAMMDLPMHEEFVAVKQLVFGDKSTWTEPEAIDYAYIKYKKLVTRLEKRLKFTDYPIEKCYLYHEISRHHLMQNKFDECASVAKKAIEGG